MSLSSLIIAASQWSAVDHMNPHLELAAKALMGWDSFKEFEKRDICEFWKAEYRDRTEISPGLFKRFPADIAGEYRAGYSTSHDEMLGITIMSYLCDEGKTIARVLDQGRILGFYFSGHSPYKARHGNEWWRGFANWVGRNIDSEWLIFINPVYRAYAKLGAGRGLSKVEELAVKLDLALTKTPNLIDLRCLLLEKMGKFEKSTKAARLRLRNSYRGRYLVDPKTAPIYQQLFELRDLLN